MSCSWRRRVGSGWMHRGPSGWRRRFTGPRTCCEAAGQAHSPSLRQSPRYTAAAAHSGEEFTILQLLCMIHDTVLQPGMIYCCNLASAFEHLVSVLASLGPPTTNLKLTARGRNTLISRQKLSLKMQKIREIGLSGDTSIKHASEQLRGYHWPTYADIALQA